MSTSPRFRRRFCEALVCNNTSVNRSMFKFPEKPERCRKWEENLELKDSNKKYRYLCSDHFEDWCFTDTFQRRLIKEAYPSIQMPCDKKEDACNDSTDLINGSPLSLLEDDEMLRLSNNDGEMSFRNVSDKDTENMKDYDVIEVQILESV